jgi:hypothetical protein
VPAANDVDDRQGWRLLGVLAVVALAAIGCSVPKASTRVIYSDHLSSLDAIITRAGVTLDTAISPDGRGVIRLDLTNPITIRLAEVRPENVEDVMLVYRGHLRTRALRGHAYLEMQCSIRGVGELPSKLSGTSVSGTTDWVSQQTEFFVDKGRQVEMIKLNVVIDGPGIVWIGPILLTQNSR